MASKKDFQLLNGFWEAQLLSLLTIGGGNGPHSTPSARADSPKGEPEA